MDLNDIRPKMEKALEILQGELSSIRTGRATSSLVENIICSVYGGTQHLKVVELGTIGVLDARTITISPWDNSIIGEIRQAILTSDVGLMPIVDGAVIRVAVPALTLERRQEYIRLLSKQLENGKVMIRQIRHEKMTEIKIAFENKEMGEDDKFRSEQDLQKITDEYVEKIDEIGSKKEAELLAI
jgi:ribosome recycling factor